MLKSGSRGVLGSVEPEDAFCFRERARAGQFHLQIGAVLPEDIMQQQGGTIAEYIAGEAGWQRRRDARTQLFPSSCQHKSRHLSIDLAFWSRSFFTLLLFLLAPAFIFPARKKAGLSWEDFRVLKAKHDDSMFSDKEMTQYRKVRGRPNGK